MLCPGECVLIVFALVAGEGHIDQTGDSVLVGLIGMAFLDEVLVLFVGFVELLHSLFRVCANLAAADVNQQVDVVAGGVALQLFDVLGYGFRRFEGILQFAFHAEQVG